MYIKSKIDYNNEKFMITSTFLHTCFSKVNIISDTKVADNFVI